jgi:hypothetical protein
MVVSIRTIGPLSGNPLGFMPRYRETMLLVFREQVRADHAG